MDEGVVTVTGTVNLDGFQTELVRRLPLAQSAIGLFDFALEAEFLDQLFEEHRGRCYEDDLRFCTLTGVIRDALLVYEGSARKAIAQAQEDGRVTVAQSSVYRKLGNLPEALSEAFLREGTRRLAEVAASPARTLPECLKDLQVIVLDGKELKKVNKRMKAARKYTSGSLLGGKLLVALSLRSGLAVAMGSTPDGEANEVPLVPHVVEQVRGLISGGVLWMCDRQMTDLDLMMLLSEREGDHFLIRRRRGITFKADGQRAAWRQRDAQGRLVVQEWGWLGSERDRRRRYVRQITLHREGQEDVVLVTDLLEEKAHPGLELLGLYLQRWSIEMMFQQVQEVFGLETWIGGTPRATIFQGGFCLLMYNIVQILRGYVAEAGGKIVGEVSAENLFWDVTQELTCWCKLGEGTVPLMRAPRTASAMVRRLGQLLGKLWDDGWLKKPDKKPRKQKSKRALPGGHGSLWKLMCRAGHPHTTLSDSC